MRISKRKRKKNTAASAGLEAKSVWKRSSCVNSDKWPANVESDLQSLSPETWMQLSVGEQHEPHW